MRRSPALVVALLLAACSDAGVTKFNARPEAQITSHADGDTVRDGYAETLRGAVSDPNHSADQLTVAWMVDGVPVCTDAVLSADGVITCEHLFEAGAAGEVSLEVRDPEGAAGVARVTLDVEETDAPAATIVSPEAGGTYYSDQLIAFQGTVSDGEDAAQDLVVTWETDGLGDLGLTTEVTSEGDVEAFGNLPEGEHAVRLRAVDSSGKEALDSVLVTVGPPNSNPTCGITSPDDGSAGQEGTEVFFEAGVGDIDIAPDQLTVVWSSDTDGELRTSVPDSDGTVRFSTDTLSVATHLVTLTVTDEVGGSCTDSIYYTVGTPPELTLIEPSDGDVVDEGDDVRFSATVSDSEDQPTDLLIDWVSDLDGTISAAGADSTGSVSFRTSALSAGDHAISVTVTDTDGLFTVRTIDLVVNAPPVVTGTTITPDPANNDDTLTCSTTATDTDGTPTVTYAWTNTTTGAALGSGNTLDLTTVTVASTDVIECEVTATDGLGSSASDSASITLSNRAPTVSVALSPATAYANDTLTCTATENDDDGDALTTTLGWTVNGSSVTATSTTGLTTTLAGAFSASDVVACTASTDDGKGGTASDSASVTISNRAPTISVALTPSTASAADTLTCTATTADADGDTLTTTFGWTVGGTTVAASSTSGLTSTLAGAFVYADVVECTASTDDGNGGTASDSDSVTISNSPPTVSSVTLTPSTLLTNDTATVNAAVSDPEGDTVTTTYDWVVDGTTVVSGSSDNTLDGATYFDKGQVVYAEVVANDGVNTTRVASSSVTVDNTPPDAPTLGISPAAPTAGDTLTCTVDVASSDDDSDSVTYTMSWEVDGVAYTAGGTSATGATFTGPSTTTWPDDTVNGADVELGQSWICTATPNDGDDDGTDGTAEVTVFEEVEFDHCGQTGATGPSQSDCDSSYTGTTLDGEVTVTSGIQYWTVPATGTYDITAAGAAGGRNTDHGYNGGSGAEMSGTFSLTAGDTLAIVVGQKGTNGSNDAGGGGGSFVYNQTTGTLLMAAGGGGSGAENDNNTSNMTTYKNGVTGTCGQDAPAHGGGLVSGGCSGNGGGIDGPTYGQGGGGGYSGNGNGSGGGYAFLNGAAGSGNGGFGGGANGGGDGGGGGGGYSGGASGSGGGSPDGPGGGGGSYNAGSSQVNTAGANTGHGYVVIEGS